MRPRPIEITVLCTERTRHLSNDPDKPNGWWVGLLLGNSTTLRLFIPDFLLREDMVKGVSPQKEPIWSSEQLEPAIQLDEMASLAVLMPVRLSNSQ